MPLTNLLLSALLSMQINAQPLPALKDTLLVDLTGDKIKEQIIYHRSYTDSSFCKVLSRKDSTYSKIWELKFKITEGDYRLYFGDYNKDNITDFTIELNDLYYYFTYDKKKKTFIMKE